MKIFLNSKSVQIILAKKNKTLGWFAEEVNISQTYVTMLFNEEKSPSPEMRDRIQKVFIGHKWEEIFTICSVKSSEVEG